MENPKFDANVYYLLKAQNKEVAKQYLKHCKDVEEREERRAEREEKRQAAAIERMVKQLEIKKQKADEKCAKFVVLGVVLFIVLLIATILCAQNC